MAKIRDGSTYLGKHLTSNDYYCENETITGRWVGRSAERLGLTGEITAGDKAFEALRNNRHPQTGEKLTGRDADGRIRFYDFQCSAPKSVSVMAVTVGDNRLLAAHDRAVSVAFRELEKFAATQANTAMARNNRTTGNVVAACFRHTASRALDPQVHSHLVTANATWDDASKSWRALTEFEMLRAIRFAGKVYQNELGLACRELGYAISEVRNDRGIVTGFEIAGVPEEIRERFSKRRAEIEVGINVFKEKHGRPPTTAEVHDITVQTRDAKLKEITTPEVLAAQRKQLSGGEWGRLDGLKSQAEQQSMSLHGPLTSGERLCLRGAIGHIYERRSVAEGHEVLAEALNQNLGHLDLARLETQAGRSGLVALTSASSWTHGHFATARGLSQEQWLVAFVETGNGRFPALAQNATDRAAALSEEQYRAVAEVLATRDQVVCLRGSAGVGKTTVIKEIRSALVGEGKTVFYCAPTTSAADTLRKDGIADATTVADFLQNRILSERARLHGAVFVVDEAGLSSNNQGAELLQVAQRYSVRVVFVGDSKQHTSVEAGDFLRILETHSPLQTVRLGDIRRQTVAEYRQAVKMMAVGGALGGLEALDRMGWVKEGKGHYLGAAVRDFMGKADDGRRLDSVVAVTPTWAENFAFTDLLRAELKARGRLSAGETVSVHDPMGWTKAQKRRAENFQPGHVVTIQRSASGFKRGQALPVLRVEAGKVFVKTALGMRVLPLRQVDCEVSRVRPVEICAGDKVLVRANDRKAGLINGEVVSVASIKEGVIAMSDGRRIDTREFKALAHGFAVTSHKSQSRSADHVVVAAERLDSKAAYVACSRGRYSCSVHTPDKELLMGRLPEGTRAAGLDFKLPMATSRRTEAWVKAGRVLRDAVTERREGLRRSLCNPWWRGLMHNLAEWSERALGWSRVDGRAKESSTTIALTRERQ